MSADKIYKLINGELSDKIVKTDFFTDIIKHNRFVGSLCIG